MEVSLATLGQQQQDELSGTGGERNGTLVSEKSSLEKVAGIK